MITPFVFLRIPQLGNKLFWKFHKFNFKNIIFYARPKDWYGVRQILVGDEYIFLNEIFGENGKLMIIDAGANIGLFSLKMFYFFPKSTIHAIEPSSDTFDVLKMNKKINNTFSWKLYDAALTRQDGEISFKNYKYLSVNN